MSQSLFPRQSVYNADLNVVAYHFPVNQQDNPGDIERLRQLAENLPVLCKSDSHESFLSFDNILKQDSDLAVLDLDKQDIETILNNIKATPDKSLPVLVINIDDWETFNTLKNNNIDYYQGNFITKPVPGKKESLATNNLVVLELLNKLQNPDIEIEELEELISRDVALSYRLLKYINSAAFALKREVDSIRHAIVMLGLNTIINLANLMLMSNLENKPKDLFMLAMTRAKMCENLSLSLEKNKKDIYFTAGLFSVIDALTDKPIDTVVSELPLIPEIKSALLEQKGTMGEILGCCIKLQNGDTEKLACAGLTPEVIQTAYLDALEWSNQANHLLPSGH